MADTKISADTQATPALTDIIPFVKDPTTTPLNRQTLVSALLGLVTTGMPPGHLFGLTLSNGTDATNDINIAAGKCRGSADANDMVLASALAGKQLDATWAVGANAGMRASGAAIADTTYHIFLIKRSDTGVVDVAADTSVTGANVTANTSATYTIMRRIGSIIRSGGTILAFTQNNDEFLLTSMVVNVNNAAPANTSAALTTVTVPGGLKVNALLRVRQDHATAAGATIFTSPDETDVAPGSGTTTLTTSSSLGICVSTLNIRTNTSSQVRRRSNDTGFTNYVLSYGWIDNRGKLS